MGQELTLFQDDGNRGFPGGSQSVESSSPGVIVKGIYRFGNTYHVSLQSGEGGAVQQFTWQQGQSQAPVFNGYQIQVVDTRNITLGLPPGMSCQPNPQFGGNCVGRNQMSVTFAQTEPIRRNNNQRTNNNNNRNNTNNNRNNNNEWWNAQNGTDIRSLIEAARANPNGPERAQVEALIRERGGRGNFNNNNNNNANGGRGGRGGGGFNGGNNNNNNNNNGGRGGGGGGRGGGGLGN